MFVVRINVVAAVFAGQLIRGEVAAGNVDAGVSDRGVGRIGSLRRANSKNDSDFDYTKHSTLPTCISSLVSISTAHELEQGEGEYLQVEPEAPILDVPEGHNRPAAPSVEPGSLPAKAIDLSPTGKAWLYVLPKCVLCDHLAITVVVRNSMRSRPDQRHVPTQHVEQLWQLVDTGGVARCGRRGLSEDHFYAPE